MAKQKYNPCTSFLSHGPIPCSPGKPSKRSLQLQKLVDALSVGTLYTVYGDPDVVKSFMPLALQKGLTIMIDKKPNQQKGFIGITKKEAFKKD